MRPHHEQRGGMPTRRRAIRTGLFALACTLYLCNGLEDSRTDTATPTGNPTSTPAALTQETPTAVSGSTLQRTSAPSSNQGANFTFPTAYMESWELAASVAESLLANSEPGFTTSLNYSRSNIITSIAVARVSPATPEAETQMGLTGALQIALPTESLQSATGPVDVIILESVQDSNTKTLTDVNDVDDGILAGFIRLSARSSETKQPFQLDFRRYPPTLRIVLMPADSYSPQFCLTRPMYIPPNTTIEWNPVYRVPEPYGADGRNADQPPYFIFGYDGDGNLHDCRTVVPEYGSPKYNEDGTGGRFVTRSLPNPADQSQQMFGTITFEGTDCPWLVRTEDRTKKFKVTTGCTWDSKTQTFAGPTCVEEEHEFTGRKSIQHCMCSAMSSYRVFSMPRVESITRAENATRLAIIEGLEHSAIIGGGLGVMILLSSCSVLAWLCSRYWQAKTRKRFLLRFVRPEMGFQMMDTLEMPSDAPESRLKKLLSSKNLRLPRVVSRGSSPKRGKAASSVSAEQIIDGSSCKVWTWDMATSSYEIILDDLEEYSKLSEKQRKTFPLFSSTVVHLSAIAGLPPNRIIAAIPNASHLPWKPRDRLVARNVSEEHWINQCLGTSMMMALLQIRHIISDSVAERQLDLQSMYFDGCNPIGFRELVLRWKVMFDEDNLYAGGWHERARVWKILWLQRFDGLWDSNEEFSTALGAQKDVLVPMVTLPGNPVGESTIQYSMPTTLSELCTRNERLAMRIWCTALATSFLGQMEEMYECFTGWEPDGSNDGYSATVLARLAIDKAIETASYEATETQKREQPDLNSLRGDILREADQAIRSFRILSATRIEKEMINQLVPILALKNKTLNPQRKRGKTLVKDARSITQQDLVALKADLQKETIARKMKWASGQRGDQRPNTIERIQASLKNSCYHFARSVIKNHGVLRILWPSPMDAISQDERMAVFATTVTCLFGLNVYFHVTGNAECCAQLEAAEGMVQDCGITDGAQYNVDFPVMRCAISYQEVTQGPPLGIVVTVNVTEELVGMPGRFFCSVLMQGVLKYHNWECDLAMNPLTLVGQFVIALVSCAICTPIKILLRTLFSLDDIKFNAAFWKKPERSWTKQLLELLRISKKDVAGAREAQTEEELAYVRDQRDAYLSRLCDDNGMPMRAQTNKESSSAAGFADNDDAEARGRIRFKLPDSLRDRDPVDGHRQMDQVAEVDPASKLEGSISQGIDGKGTHDDRAKLLGGVSPTSFSVAASAASGSRTHQQCRTAERVGASEQLSTTVPTQQQQEEAASRGVGDSVSLALNSSHERRSSLPPRMASSRNIGSPSTVRKQDRLASRRNRLPATNGAGATPLIAPSFSKLSSRSSSRSLRPSPSPQTKHSQK